MGTTKSYTVGFVLSIALTLVAYFTVTNSLLAGSTLLWVIMGMAMIQLAVQLIFFLHLGQEPRPKWNLLALFITACLIFIVIAGSLWIMQNLSYHIPSDQEIIRDEGISR